MASASKADLIAPLQLLDHDEGNFGASNSQCQVDGILGVAWQRPRFGEIFFFSNIGVDQLAFEFGFRSRENATSQTNTPDRIPFIKIPVDG